MVGENKAPKGGAPPGFHTTAREPKRAHFRVQAYKNTTKLHKRGKMMKIVASDGKKSAKFWAVRRRRGPLWRDGSAKRRKHQFGPKSAWPSRPPKIRPKSVKELAEVGLAKVGHDRPKYVGPSRPGLTQPVPQFAGPNSGRYLFPDGVCNQSARESIPERRGRWCLEGMESKELPTTT